MPIKNYIILFLTLAYATTLTAAPHEDNKPSDSSNPPQKNEKSSQSFDETVKKRIPPLPRHVFLPSLTYARAPDIVGEFTLDFSEHKYWIITIIASWNKRSANIAQILNSHISEFEERNIGVLALYSQNTEEDVEKWKVIQKPLFKNYFASRNFIDKLNNPKVPHIWLLGSQGEILLEYELPSIRQIDTLVEKSFILTGF